MKGKNYTILITIISVAIPVIVAVLFYMPKPDVQVGFDLTILPAFHAILNFMTAVLLGIGFFFINKKRIELHKRCMLAAFVFSIIFLISYVTYHLLTEPARYEGVGFIRYIYFLLLITHIIFAVVIVPLALITLVKALSEKYDQHRKIARITFPLWLYVAVTGVAVYFMLAPYY